MAEYRYLSTEDALRDALVELFPEIRFEGLQRRPEELAVHLQGRGAFLAEGVVLFFGELLGLDLYGITPSSRRSYKSRI